MSFLIKALSVRYTDLWDNRDNPSFDCKCVIPYIRVVTTSFFIIVIGVKTLKCGSSVALLRNYLDLITLARRLLKTYLKRHLASRINNTKIPTVKANKFRYLATDGADFNLAINLTFAKFNLFSLSNTKCCFFRIVSMTC